jgi:hypothetical protein
MPLDLSGVAGRRWQRRAARIILMLRPLSQSACAA